MNTKSWWRKGWFLSGFCFVLAHAVFFWYDCTHDGWGPFLTFMLDLPASYFAVGLKWINPIAALLIVGSLWWFLIGAALAAGLKLIANCTLRWSAGQRHRRIFPSEDKER
jgi:hypothetical protein